MNVTLWLETLAIEATCPCPLLCVRGFFSLMHLLHFNFITVNVAFPSVMCCCRISVCFAFEIEKSIVNDRRSLVYTRIKKKKNTVHLVSSLSCVCFSFLFSEFCSSCLTHLSHALCEWTSVGFLVCMLQWEKPLWLCVTAGPSPHLCVTWLWPWSSVSAHPECLDASALALELLHCNWLAFLPRLVLLPCPVFSFPFQRWPLNVNVDILKPPPLVSGSNTALSSAQRFSRTLAFTFQSPLYLSLARSFPTHFAAWNRPTVTSGFHHLNLRANTKPGESH